jgi:coproporphyrinogen III oxidase-like Fe-S oxidoreductase
VADFEQLGALAEHTEDVMLRLRLRWGLAVEKLSDRERERTRIAIRDGLLSAEADRLVLTDRGRLLADAVVRTVLD